MLLAQHGLEGSLQLSHELLDRLRAAPWPGNVRELRNLVVRFALHPDSIGATAAMESSHNDARTLRDRASNHEREIIVTTLKSTNWNVASAADQLDMHVTTLRRKMRRLEVQRPT